MKRVFTIFLFLLPLLGFLPGCEDNEDILPTQRTRIRQYLGSTHTPSLSSEAEAAQAIDENIPFYTVAGDSVYRYIRNYYDPDRDSYPSVDYGDAVTLTFRMYVFEYSNVIESGADATMPYYTNDVLLEQRLYNTGLTPGAWSFEPLRIELGNSRILKGLELALVGCKARDTVEAYMTYNMAYGEDPLGVVPKESPLAVFFTVDEVAKQ